MTGEARFVRLALPSLMAVALALGIALPHGSNLPAVALGTTGVLYAERTLAFFYGGLLLLVPLVRSRRGQLPIELSARGARYEEAKASEDALQALDTRLNVLESTAVEVANVLAGTAERVAMLEDES